MKLDNYRQRKTRGMSVEDIIELVSKEEGIESIAILTVKKDEEIEFYASIDSLISTLGHVEALKQLLWEM